MPRKKGRQFETFGDGVLTICVVSGRKLVRNRIDNPVRFGNRTVGISRFYQAKVATDAVSRLVSIPLGPEIKETDMVVIDDVQYSISQIQNKFDAEPPCRYLALRESPIRFEDVRQNGNDDSD